jgi:hypothetical protein
MTKNGSLPHAFVEDAFTHRYLSDNNRRNDKNSCGDTDYILFIALNTYATA